MNTAINKQKFFAIIPAAGVGSRMQSQQPKQYLNLHGKTVLEHTVEKLLSEKKFQRIVIPVSAKDKAWQSLTLLNNKRIDIIEGGSSRCQSVLNSLNFLSAYCSDIDWVLVHDVARPCVSLSDVNLLMNQLCNDEVGGLLAVPVSDTIKKVNSNLDVIATIDRSSLWQAQTPQMFRYLLLLNALKKANEKGTVTDEASAVELAGKIPKIVEGSRVNIKITRPEDLLLARLYLQHNS